MGNKSATEHVSPVQPGRQLHEWVVLSHSPSREQSMLEWHSLGFEEATLKATTNRDCASKATTTGARRYCGIWTGNMKKVYNRTKRFLSDHGKCCTTGQKTIFFSCCKYTRIHEHMKISREQKVLDLCFVIKTQSRTKHNCSRVSSQLSPQHPDVSAH